LLKARIAVCPGNFRECPIHCDSLASDQVAKMPRFRGFH
jgi:hypothetical protein